MIAYQVQIIETAVLIILLFSLLRILYGIVQKVGVKFSYNEVRIKIVKKVISLTLNSIFFIVFLLIWGIAPSRLVGYIASLFTVVGIGFLAQWSIMSNVTATIIIFFNHQVKIGDTIAILDKDTQIEGRISDIGIFFIIIEVDNHEFVSLPSNIFMQKMIKKTSGNKASIDANAADNLN